MISTFIYVNLILRYIMCIKYKFTYFTSYMLNGPDIPFTAFLELLHIARKYIFPIFHVEKLQPRNSAVVQKS